MHVEIMLMINNSNIHINTYHLQNNTKFPEILLVNVHVM